jgi:hypothetical protein
MRDPRGATPEDRETHEAFSVSPLLYSISQRKRTENDTVADDIQAHEEALQTDQALF